MAGTEKISSGEVRQIASGLENLNNQLKAELESGKKIINALNSSWTGVAADDTINTFNGFHAKYSANYEEAIKGYVTFLRVNVAEQYESTEDANKKLADQFK